MLSGLLVLAVVHGLAYFVIWPLAAYLIDRKGLRKFPAFHPLAGLSNVPFMLESQRGFRSRTLLDMHRDDKPIIRTGPNSLSYGETSAIKAIYGHSTPTTKDAAYSVSAGTHRHLADVVDKPDHARKRKMLASAFAAKNLEGWEYKVADKVNRMVSQLNKHAESRPEKPLNFRAWANFYTIDALADICLSEETSTIDRGDDSVLAETIDGRTWEVGFRDCLYATFHATGDLLWPYAWFKTIVKISKVVSPLYRRLWSLAGDWAGLVQHLTQKRWDRYDEGERVDDLFAALMEDKDAQPHDLEWGEVVAEISLMISGSSSTSNTIGSVLFQLLENPQVWSRLQREVDGALDPEETVGPYEKIKFLPYLRACIDEGLRMYPPISHGLPRETPPEGMAIESDWIAGNTTVAVSAFVAHRDPKAFPKPDVYKPERWLGDAGKALQPHFIAFSAGSRGCIGRPISYLMTSVLLATLAKRYDLSLWDPSFTPTRRETMNLILGDVPIRVRKRGPVEDQGTGCTSVD